MVTGHSHIQHTKRFVSKKGTLNRDQCGLLCGYPGPICEITVQPDQTLFYEVRHLASFRLGGEEIDAQRFFKRHATAMIRRVGKAPDRRGIHRPPHRPPTAGGRKSAVFMGLSALFCSLFARRILAGATAC